MNNGLHAGKLIWDQNHLLSHTQLGQVIILWVKIMENTRKNTHKTSAISDFIPE